MVSSRVAGGVARSSSSSRILFQGDGKSQVVGNSQPSPSFGNSSNSTPGAGRSNLGPMSGDASNTVLNSVPTSGPSAGASSLVTDANSGLSGGPHLQRNASFNTESYMRLPASPMSFSSNNVSISGSSIMDGSSVVQQNSNQDPSSQQVLQSRQQQGASSATSLPIPRVGQISLSTGSRIPGSFIPDANNIYQQQSSVASVDSAAEIEAPAATVSAVYSTRAASPLTAAAAAAAAVETTASTTEHAAHVFREASP